MVLRDETGLVLDGKLTVAESNVPDGGTLYIETCDRSGGLFAFTSWRALAAAALVAALVGLATAVSLFVLKGPTPSGVS